MPESHLAFLFIFGFFAVLIVCALIAMWVTSRW